MVWECYCWQTVWRRLICVLVAHSSICTHVLHPCWTCAFYTYAHTILQAAQELQRYSQIFQIFPLSTDTQAHTSTPLTPLYLCRSTSAECRHTCHKRSKTLTISEFTSAQAQGSARSDRPPNRLVIKDKDTEEGMKEGLRKKEGGREGGKECGYLLSDSPAEMCWDDTSFYIWCVHSVVKPHQHC